MVWTLERFWKLLRAVTSSSFSTTRTLPSRLSAARAETAALVLGASKPQSSTTRTLPSAARSDRAERRARRIIFLGVRWA
jgi:hypothetical protein